MAHTIALVDDDRNLLTGISIALEREGFKVQTYIDGESALIGLTRNPPDLLVLDIIVSLIHTGRLYQINDIDEHKL